MNQLLVQKIKKIYVGYAGTLGISHGLENIVKHFSALRDRYVFLLIGSGARFNILHTMAKEHKNIIVLEAVDQKKLSDFYQFIDISGVSPDIPQYDKVIPSKIFESVAYNKPVLAAVGEAKHIIEKMRLAQPSQITIIVNLGKLLKKLKKT